MRHYDAPVPDALKILCTADLHVGRRPTRIGQDAAARACSAAAMFGEIVALAIRESVDLLAIAGDLVDRDNRYHEAFGPVESGLRELKSAGIEAVAVGGNHDFDVLPRLSDDVQGADLKLLGRGGKWESLDCCGGRLRVVGWSFPAAHHPADPMAGFAFARSAAPTLGLLHTQLDAPASPYAATTSAALAAAPVDAWLLGHVHAPLFRHPKSGPPLLYPGSPQALDPGETGDHGPWLLTLDAGDVTATQLPLSRVLYDALDLDCAGVTHSDDLDRLANRALGDWVDARRRPGLRFLRPRLRLTGRTKLHGKLSGWAKELTEQFDADATGSARVDSVTDATSPDFDLDDLARGRDLAGELARALIALQTGGEADLVGNAERGVAAVDQTPAYRPVTTDAADARGLLVRQAADLLATLLQHRHGPAGGAA